MEKAFTKLDYSGQNIYIGLDTHLKNWRATIRVGDTFYKSFSQDPEAVILSKYLHKHFPGGNYYSAYEASFSGFKAHRELTKLGIYNIVVNPADIPTTDKERKQKEDARDSRKIAEQLAGSNLVGIHIPDIEIEGDRSLLRFRKTMTKEIARNKVRVKSFLYYHGVIIPERFSKTTNWSRQFTRWLKALDLGTSSSKATLTSIIELVLFLRGKHLEILQLIRALSKQERYKTNVGLLMSIPGIGLVTAMTFLTEIEDMSRFKNLDKLCSYIGLVPMTNSSGDHDSIGPITKRQNKVLRSMIVESSWVAIRNDPALMLAYQKLIVRMQPSKAIIRIAKKMVNRMRYVLKNQTPYVKAVVE
uniref:IS110 family transposase n=1 Tax=Mariniflexile sp. TaxID=1979402 RepID=UPI0040475341